MIYFLSFPELHMEMHSQPATADGDFFTSMKSTKIKNTSEHSKFIFRNVTSI